MFSKPAVSAADRERILEILAVNSGFENPHEWVSRALALGFRRVPSWIIRECPDCGSSSAKIIARQVFYSTSIGMRRCEECALVYLDTRLAGDTIAAHFETSYKDEDYFQLGRAPVFSQLVKQIDAHARPGGRVLDVGGAKGHLLAMLRVARPDLALTLTDVSEAAIQHAAKHYHLRALQGGLSTIERLSERFDVIVLSDVLYYEPELEKLWRALNDRLASSGTLIIRLPNHHGLTIAMEAIKGLFRSARAKRTSESISFFNPEHLYSFSRRYMSLRLKRLGFGDVEFQPSALTRSRRVPALTAFWTQCAEALWRGSRGALSISPSVVVVATRALTDDAQASGKEQGSRIAS